MNTFKNTQGITTIELTQNIQSYCPLGNDYYTNQVYIRMDEMKTIPDFCELEKFLRGLSGEKLIIEDVVAKVFDKLDKEHNPKHLEVSSTVNDAVHFPVVVTKRK